MGHLVHVADDEGEGSGADELVPLGQPLPRRPLQLQSAGRFTLQLLLAPRSLILPDRPQNRVLLHGAREPSPAPSVAGGRPHGKRAAAAPVREGRAWREHAEEGPVAAASAAVCKEEEMALGLQHRGRHGVWSELRARGVVFEFRRAVYRASGHEKRKKCVRNCCALNSFRSCAAERRARSRERVVGVARGPHLRVAPAHLLVHREAHSDTWRLLTEHNHQQEHHEASKW